MRLPTHLDRYPAKMVSRLAGRLVDMYARDADHLFDPFCGSAAVVAAAQQRGIRTTGSDLNPIAELFFRVKLGGFDAAVGYALVSEWIISARRMREGKTIDWHAKSYWFTSATLNKFERLRAAWHELGFPPTHETAAALLSFALAVRLCSRADQRSPKPFISKQATTERKRRHFDPYRTVLDVLVHLADLYPSQSAAPPARFVRVDITSETFKSARIRRCSHVITSPPYINAQDYYRNFKLELHVLEGLLPFRVSDLRESFIGTDRGKLLTRVPPDALDRHRSMFLSVSRLEARSDRLSAVLHRYLHDMDCAFSRIREALVPHGMLVMVCGDNLLAGLRVPTWKLLDRLLVDGGFVLRDRFTDSIGDRLLAPKRHGHKGLIKREVVSAYQLV